MFYGNFDQPILLKFGVYKWKPLSSFSFRQLHRSLIEFHDYELQQAICDIAGVPSIKDELSFGYCCVDEQFGLQIHMLAACNRDGRMDWWVPVPEGKELVLSYHDAKDKMISLSDSYAAAVERCLPRCKLLMEQHEKNPTIMLQALDKFRNIEYPLDIQITIPAGRNTTEQVYFRPTEAVFRGIKGILLDEPQSNAELHKGDPLEVKFIYNKHRQVIAVKPLLRTDWILMNDGSSIGEVGVEDGIIVEDEEYAGRCRITLEDCTDHFAITCGIYGSIVHTAFCGKDNAYALYEEMKEDLQFICNTTVPSYLEETSFFDLINDFTEKY